MLECLQSAAEAAKVMPPAPLAAVAQDGQHACADSPVLWLKGIPAQGKPEEAVSTALTLL